MSNLLQKYIFNLKNKKNSITLHYISSTWQCESTLYVSWFALSGKSIISKSNQMRFSNNLIFILFVISLLFLETAENLCSAQSFIFKNNPKYEVRAVWLTTIGGLDWPHCYAQGANSINKQKRELVEILDKLKSANINTVLLQTRIRGTVIYPSVIEPWDGCMSGKPGTGPGYDPLAFVIEECHKRGMELHAWVVTIPIGKWNALGCKSIRNKNPKLVIKNGVDGFINPASPSAAPYLAAICKEITENYDVDGIHLDYIRYPETFKLNISNGAARENITAIVRQISKEVKLIKPWVKLSCSPIGKHDDLSRYSSHGWNAYTKGCQDAQNWLKLGLMDQLYPMMYFRGNQFFPFALDWKENSYGRTIVPGLGVYFLSPKEANWSFDEIQRQMNFLRMNNMGFAFFRNKFFCDNIKELYSFTKERFNLFPALVPPMTWVKINKPEAPKTMSVTVSDDYTTVSWSEVDNIPQGGLSYNVYASKTFPVDINDVRNLLEQKVVTNRLTIKNKEHLFYAVTSVDRYGYESSAIQQNDINGKSTSYVTAFIKNDGKRLLVPEKGNVLDAEYLIIKDFKGQTITTLPFKGKYVSIAKIKDGQYVVYSLNKKGVTHRLGFLSIYRGK